MGASRMEKIQHLLDEARTTYPGLNAQDRYLLVEASNPGLFAGGSVELLRTKYIRDLTVRGRAKRTQRAYTRYVSELARYYQRSPELISYEEVTNWLYHLITERQPQGVGGLLASTASR
jgi:hypothetical protein